jgi:hypothetical protein
MPVYDLSSGFAGLDNGINSLGASLQSAGKQQLLQKLGTQLQSGDYDGAAATAFQTGDVNTGLAIQKMKQQQQANAQLSGSLQGSTPSNAAPAASSDASQGQSQAPSSATDDDAKAISSVESGGKYSALGPVTASGDRAYGKYQVMGANIPSWTKDATGQELTPRQFLANPSAQDTVFAHRFGQYVQQTGNPQDAASMWFTGKPLAQGAGAKDQLGTSGQAYVDKFNAALGPILAQRAQLAPADANAVAQPGAAGQGAVPQDVIDKFQEANPHTVGDESLLPDGSFRMDAGQNGLAWAAENAGKYGLAVDPTDPSRFVTAGNTAASGAASASAPTARQQALTAQLPQGAAAASTTKIDALPHGDPTKLDYYLRMQALATQSGNEGYAALFKQKADIEKEALTPTTSQKNYEYYVRQELGAGRPPLSFRDYTNGVGDSAPALGSASQVARVTTN